ncbi:MAG: hypothetical protein H0X65_05825 [Gemmatimonadetes bacterium]|nr:hypothetical protein [Gemmatimonadota bacterium]
MNSIMSRIAAAGLLFVFWAVMPDRYQAGEDHERVMLLAALAVRAEFADRPVTVDLAPSVEQQGVLASRIAAAMDGRVSSLQNTMVCTSPSPRDCRLGGSIAHRRLHPPIFATDRASVRIETRFQSHSSRQPVGAKVFDVSLVRGRQGWEVADKKVIAVT